MFGDFQPFFMYCKALVQHPTEKQPFKMHGSFRVPGSCMSSPFKGLVTTSRGVCCKVLQLQVEIPRSCWSSGRSGKAEFCRWSVGVVWAGFFCDFFFFGGGSEKNKIRFLRVPDYDSMINMNHMIWLYGCFLFGSGYLWPMALENFHFNLWMFQLDDHPGSRFFSWLNLRSANKTPCWKHAWGNLSLHLKRKDRQLEGSTENFWWKFMEISDGPRAPRFQ